MASSTHIHLSSLPDFIEEAFAQLISASDAEADAALTKFWSPHVQESDVATSSHISRAGFRKVVDTIRTQFAERKLVKDNFVVATPADASNRTGALAATHVFTALQDGKPVTVTVVAMLRIEWVHEEGHHHGGRREVVTEAFIINTTSS
ncbi:hypothetical protein B0H19DRAFT_1257373 [Mycena capillaripes]|nr:hypothetical protein B0H19DRAFT_1257373 [Mycena capillaripes]